MGNVAALGRVPCRATFHTIKIMNENIKNDNHPNDLKGLHQTSTNVPASTLVVLFYNSQADLTVGRAWVPLLQSLSVFQEGSCYHETTARGNGVVIYRRYGPDRHYELLISVNQIEVLASYGESTYLAQCLLDRVRQNGVNTGNFAPLNQHDELLLLERIKRHETTSALTIL